MQDHARTPVSPALRTLEDVDWSSYDFIDLGSSKGGSLKMCRGRFDAQRGIGVDIDPSKVEIAQARGVEAVLGDARNLPPDCGVRFVSMVDFLEHLPDLETVGDVIASAARAATDFLFISHPSFEGEGYLESLGLRQYWWNWRGHPVHPQVSDYCEIFDRLGLRQYMIRNETRVHDSTHPSILPKDAPRDQGNFDPSRHPPKPQVRFEMPIWRAQTIYVALRAFEPREWRHLTEGAAAARLARRRRARRGLPEPSAAPAAAKEAESAGERTVARKALPYLRESGWINSHRTRSAVDAESRPVPWYRYAATDFLAARISPELDVFEFGSGNSTLWWAQRVRSVVAVEHDPGWATEVAAAAPANAEVLRVPVEPDGDYCRTPQRLERAFHVLVIDGRDRVNCARQGVSTLTDDGVIVWDDSHRRRYAIGLSYLEQRGFRQLEFTGLGPIEASAGETSILYRPGNCLGI